MKYYGVTQSHCGHEYRWIFEEDVIKKELGDFKTDESIDVLWPMGGSNSSATYITRLKRNVDILIFLKIKGDGPDVEDPELVDIAEYLVTIETDCGSCTQAFLDKFNLSAKELTQEDDRYNRRKKCESMIVDIANAKVWFTDHNIDLENPFYGDSKDMRYSELCDIYKEYYIKSIQMDFAGYGNGHAHYYLINVSLDDFLKWAKDYAMNAEELIGGVKELKGYKVPIVSFDTCEKYGPIFIEELTFAFPGILIYGIDEWGFGLYAMCSGNDVEASSRYDLKIDTCFLDGDYLRLDFKIKDKFTGLEFCIGDLTNEIHNLKDLEKDVLFRNMADFWEYSYNAYNEELIKQPEIINLFAPKKK